MTDELDDLIADGERLVNDPETTEEMALAVTNVALLIKILQVLQRIEDKVAKEPPL